MGASFSYLSTFSIWCSLLVVVDPNFYSKNHLMLGKTLLRMNKKEKAKHWLGKAVNENPCKSPDDEEVRVVYKWCGLFGDCVDGERQSDRQRKRQRQTKRQTDGQMNGCVHASLIKFI